MAGSADSRDYWYTITPSGIRQSRFPLSARLRTFWHDLASVKYIVYSELKARVFDKSLGWCWLLVEPILMSLLYWFITAVMFSLSADGRSQFLYIMVALIFFRFTSRAVDKSPSMIIGYSGVIRQTVYPISSLFITFLAEEFVQFVMGFGVLIVFLALFGIFPGWTIVFLPLIMLPQLLLTACLTAVFAVIGTFFKDLAGILYAFTSIWWYFSPGIYSLALIQQRAPHWVWLFKLNPFYFLLNAYRVVLLDHRVPDLGPILLMTVLFAVPCWLVLKLFYYARYYYFQFL